MTKGYYVTTPIYYVNDKPHIGHAYTTIAADVLARWHRLKGENVFFLTGTDEHGQKVEQAAKAKNMDVKAFVDSVAPLFKESWKLLNISYDRFIRTTDKDHANTVKTIIQRCNKQGDIYKGTYEGLYCVSCETYYTPLQSPEKKCPDCGKDVSNVKEDSYFFRLSRYRDKLLEHYKTNPLFISPPHRKKEIINRVEEGLKDLSITRTSFTWGIPFPLDPHHVTYVWFDALTNYLTGIQWPAPNHYWPADTHLVGKEIIWFHTVIWPAMLMSAGIDLPKQVFAHGWLTVNGEKMSKSKGNFIPPEELIRKYGVDGTRYGLLRDIPFGNDGDFNEAALVKRIRAELADSLGNLLQRSLVMIHKYCDGNIPQCGKLDDDAQKLKDMGTHLFEHMDRHVRALEFHKALETNWAFISQCNKYINDAKPWAVTQPEKLHSILYTVVESLRLIAHVILPFMPASGEKMLQQLGQKQDPTLLSFQTTTTGKVRQAQPLFSKDVEVEDPFSKLDLRVAVIKSVEQHPNADKLYIVKVDMGEERTLCAGLKGVYQPEELIDKTIVVVANLQPADLRGVKSEGMMLAADKKGEIKIIHAKGKPGDDVTVKGIPKHAKKEITLKEFQQVKLTTKNNCVLYNEKKLSSPTAPLFAELDDAKVR